MVLILDRFLAPDNPNRLGAIREYGARLNVAGNVTHSTANPGANALDHAEWLLKDVGACFHICSDWDRILAFLPWRPGLAQPAWHALGNGNRRFLAWEICETADPAKFERSWGIAVEGHAQMLQVWGQDIDFLLNHRQVTRWWPEDHGDHTDPMPYFAKWGRTWGQFVGEVDQALRGLRKPVTAPVVAPTADAWKLEALAKAKEEGLLSDLHKPGEPVEMEEMAAMGLRLNSRIAAVIAQIEKLRGVAGA